MLNPTPLQALRTTPNRSSPHIWNPLTQRRSIDILISERSVLHIIRDHPKAIKRIKCTAVVTIQCAEEKRWLAV